MEVAWPPSLIGAVGLLAEPSCHRRSPFHVQMFGTDAAQVVLFVARALNAWFAVKVIEAWHWTPIVGQPGPSVEKIVIRAGKPDALSTVVISELPLSLMPPPARMYMPS